MSKPETWVDGPFPLITSPAHKLPAGEKEDVFVKTASEMACVHNTIIRGLNAIYLQAPHVKPQDEHAFLNFTNTWIEYVGIHHRGEERSFFPAVEAMCGETGVMEANVEQHHLFHAGLEGLEAHVAACLRDEENFDGGRIVKLIDGFGKVLAEHMEDEITTLMELRRFGEDKMADLWNALQRDGDECMKEAGITTTLVFCLVNHDLTFEDGRWSTFPPAPWYLIWSIRNISYYVHSDWWKFSPLDLSGRPKRLFARPEGPQ